jgi:D-glutamate cyclase
MTEAALEAIRDLIQEDVGHRGLRTDPSANLITACAGDFVAACRSLVEPAEPAVGIVTGFYIPHALPPCGETDGPLGALFLARILVPLGIKVVLVTDGFCARSLEIGLASAGLRKQVPLVALPPVDRAGSMSGSDYWQEFVDRAGQLTHLIALERVGPSHTPESLNAQPGSGQSHVEQFLTEVPPEHHDRCHTMRGRDITATMSPAHRLFEVAAQSKPPLCTIGIGDGGNEIGMGKIPWDVIRRNIPGGGMVACRVPTDFLIVCGVSNWGAYGLAAGVRLLQHAPPDPQLFHVDRERELLELMVQRGPLVDGVTGLPTTSVDGLPFEGYAAPLVKLATIRPD